MSRRLSDDLTRPALAWVGEAPAGGVAPPPAGVPPELGGLEGRDGWLCFLPTHEARFLAENLPAMALRLRPTGEWVTEDWSTYPDEAALRAAFPLMVIEPRAALPPTSSAARFGGAA